MKNILFICTKYDHSGSMPWLTNELAAALLEQNNRVSVLHVDWSCKNESRTYFDNGLDVHVVAMQNYSVVGRVGKILKWGWAPLRARKELLKMLDSNAYDCVLTCSPSITDFWLLRSLNKIPYRINILWDFFPTHHRQIGLVPKVLERALWWVERWCISQHSHVGLMSKRNMEYFDRYFSVPIDKFLLPIWGASSNCAMPGEGVDGAFKLLFGGQICEGRGVELLFDIADMAATSGLNIEITIIGWGRDYEKIRKRSEFYESITVLPKLSRKKYKHLLSNVDVGLIVTDPTIDVPSFPSKCIDYMDAGIPILAHVEAGTDFGEFIAEEAVCGLASYGQDLGKFFDNVKILLSDTEKRSELGYNGMKYFRENMTAQSAASRVLHTINHE